MKRSARCGISLIFLVFLMFDMTVFAAAAETTTISGRLVSSSGDPIKLTGTYGSFSFTTVNGASVSFESKEVTLSADGTFSVTVSDTTGQYKMRFSTEKNNSINVLPNKNFFYKQDADASSPYYHQGTTLDLSSGDISGLELVVDTGWTLSGTVRLDEGAVLSGPDDRLAWMWFGLRSEDDDYPNLYSLGFYLHQGESSWAYHMIVPKSIGKCSLMVNHISPEKDVESNLYTGKLDIAPLEITGDMELPDIILSPARAIITADITVKEYVATGVDIYVVTANNVYHGEYTDYYGGNFAIPVTIPKEDTADTYKIYYEISYDESGSLITGPVYVAEDGSLTTDASKAGDFPIQNTTYFVDPLKMPPFAEGRVYIPNYSGEIFYVTVGARRGNTTYCKNTTTVSSATAQLDEEQGRYYIPYSLASNQVKDGTTYYLYVTVNYDKGDNGRWNAGTFYADEDGGPVVEWSKRFIFTVDEGKSNELDVSLLLWNDDSEWMFIQGEHGITVVPTGSVGPYTVDYPGATSLKVTFSARTDVYLLVNGTQYSNSDLAGNTIEVTGDTLTIEYADRTYYKDVLYGFAVTAVEPVYGDGGSLPNGVVVVYSVNGTDKETLLEDLVLGNDIRVTLNHSEDIAGSILVAAVYDADGKMLEAASTEITFGQGMGTAFVDLDPCAGAADLRLMLLTPDTCDPLMAHWSL